MNLRVLLFLLFVTACNCKSSDEEHESDYEDHRDDDGFCEDVEPDDGIKEKYWDDKSRHGLYMPLSTKYAAFQMAKAFRPSIKKFNKTSMKHFCPRFYRLNDHKCYLTAFGKKAEFECKMTNGHYGRRHWHPHHNDHIARHFKGDNTTVVWTDNEKYMLAIRCHRERRDWKVLSTSTHEVSKDSLVEIKKYLEKYNISTNHKRMYRVNYDDCEKRPSHPAEDKGALAPVTGGKSGKE